MKLFQFSVSRMAFLQNGRPVKPAVVKAAAEAAVLQARSDLQHRANELQRLAIANGRFSTAEINAWLRDTKEILMDVHGANAVLARGGFELMQERDWTRVAAKVAEEHRVAERVAARALSGGYRSNLESGHFLNHVGNMANAGRSTYENTKTATAADELGHDEFKRILGGSDHCQSRGGRLGCEDAAEMGWVSEQDLIPIGDCACHDNCHCVVISRRSGQRARLGF